MKYSQSSMVYFNFSLQDAIRHLHSFGYQGIEIWGGRPHAYRRDLDGQMEEILSLLETSSMVVPNFIPAQFRYPSVLCSFNEQVRQDSLGYIKDAIDTAVLFSSPYVSLCPGMTLRGEDLGAGWNILKKSFSELTEYAKDKHITLLIEPAHKYESTLILTVEDGLRMIDELGSDRLGILLDTGHAKVNGEDLAMAIRSVKGIPLHIHIDDNDGSADAHLMPGEGTIDYTPMKEALEEIGYNGFISAELGFGYTYDPDPIVEKTYSWLVNTFGKPI